MGYFLTVVIIFGIFAALGFAGVIGSMLLGGIGYAIGSGFGGGWALYGAALGAIVGMAIGVKIKSLSE